MTKSKPKDAAASVRQRLLNQARATNQDFQRLLVRYGVERLLYRLSVSQFRDRFVLKGAMLFVAWADAPYRTTGDLDLLGYGSNEPEAVATVFAELCRLSEVDPYEDGLTFLPDSVAVSRMREDEDYPGVHVRLEATLKTTRIPVLIDIGFGDAVTPAPTDLSFPCILPGAPVPVVRAYPPETVVAEKLNAMAQRGESFTRLKDHYDLWAITRTFSFEAQTLAAAIGATFERRGYAVLSDWPACLSLEFAERADRLALWQAFLRRAAPTAEPPPFPEVVTELRTFFEPIIEGRRESAAREWRPSAGWVE